MMTQPTEQPPLTAGTQHLLFEFERDLYPELRCIPMAVRYKLDLAGLKLSLKAWNRLSLDKRSQLLTGWPVENEREAAALRRNLLRWLRELSDEPVTEVQLGNAPAWEQTRQLPPEVAEEAMLCDPPVTVWEWQELLLMERVALVKLASSRHERDRFARAVREFRLRRGYGQTLPGAGSE